MSLMFLVMRSAFLPHDFAAAFDFQSCNESQTYAHISCAAERRKTPPHTKACTQTHTAKLNLGNKLIWPERTFWPYMEC